MLPISCTILTKNAARTLKKTLDALTDFDEVVILDSGSSDATLKIASLYPNVNIHHSPFLGFGPQHNLATSLAKHDWVLSIDGDEIVTSKLSQRLKGLTLNPDAVYSFPRLNILYGKKIRFSGWYPDRVCRLYHRKKTSFSLDQVHEKIISQGLKEIRLHEPIEHYSYLDARDFLNKMQVYTDLYKEQHLDRKVSFFTVMIHTLFGFIKPYVIKLGFLDGVQGLMIALYQAQTAYYKYLKLWESSHR